MKMLIEIFKLKT